MTDSLGVWLLTTRSGQYRQVLTVLPQGADDLDDQSNYTWVRRPDLAPGQPVRIVLPGDEYNGCAGSVEAGPYGADVYVIRMGRARPTYHRYRLIPLALPEEEK